MLQSPEGSGRMARGPSGALSVWPLRWFLLSLSHGHLLRGLPGIAPLISSLHWTCLRPRGGGATLEDPSCPPRAWADVSHLACSLWAQRFRILPCPSSAQGSHDESCLEQWPSFQKFCPWTSSPGVDGNPCPDRVPQQASPTCRGNGHISTRFLAHGPVSDSVRCETQRDNDSP